MTDGQRHSGPHWLMRLGSDRVVSWPSAGLLVAFSLVFVVIANPKLIGAGFARPLAATLLALPVLVGTVAIGRATVLRSRATNRWGIRVLAVYVVASVLRSIVNAAVLVAFGVISTDGFIARVVLAFPSFTAALVVIDLSLGSLEEHRATMRSLLALEEAARRERDEARADSAALQSDVLALVDSEIDDGLIALDRDQPADVVDRLRASIDDVVRPLSHSIRPPSVVAGTRHDRHEEHGGWRAVLDDATGVGAFRPLEVAIALFVFGAIYVFVALPPGQAVIELTLATLGSWALLSLINVSTLDFRRTASLPGRAVLLTAAPLGVGLLLAAVSLVILEVNDTTLRLAVAYVVLIPVLSWGFALAQATESQRKRLEARQRSRTEQMDWEATHARGVAWLETQDLAQTLHGPVQGALGAAAIRLSLALQAGNVDDALRDEVRHELEVARLALRNPTSIDRGLDSLRQELRDVASTWTGVCDITWTMSEPAVRHLEADPACARLAAHVATEGSWNAIRHGGATTVEITFDTGTAAPGSVIIIVADNGTGLDAGAPPGLGTQLLDDVALTWSRTRLGAKTRVSVELPCLTPPSRTTA